jgi:type IV secretion system protein VirB9
MKHIIPVMLIIAWTCTTALAAVLPDPGEHDSRVRFVTYKKDEVTVVNVRRGNVTRIVLADDEKIAVAATGFAADCSKDELEWCVRADVGTNQIWVKPKDNATKNNLELKTDKRDYSIEFKVLNNAAESKRHKKTAVLEADPMFRIIFRYSAQSSPSATDITAFNVSKMQAVDQAREKEIFEDRIAHTKPVPRNWNYSMQVLQGSDDIAPSMVFDDGRFTYFRFPANREVPSIYYISPNEEEARINYHMDGDLAVIQRMGQRFVLRLGQSVVGIWNDAFDPDGVAPREGTTIDGILRTTTVRQ